MTRNQSRRQFINSTTVLGITFVLKPFDGFLTGKPGPDHFLFGCSSLQAGIDFIKDQTGVEAIKGGKHPNVGTHNALISLGEKSYLEIIAPDPEAASLVPGYEFLKGLNAPTLFMWAAHTENMDELLRQVQQAGYKNSGINPGSRQRTDGSVLKWRALSVETPAAEGVPFFIEWDKSSLHPSVNSPKGCTIESFEIKSAEPEILKEVFRQLQIGIPVIAGAQFKLQLKIKSPRGIILL